MKLINFRNNTYYIINGIIYDNEIVEDPYYIWTIIYRPNHNIIHNFKNSIFVNIV